MTKKKREQQSARLNTTVRYQITERPFDYEKNKKFRKARWLLKFFFGPIDSPTEGIGDVRIFRSSASALAFVHDNYPGAKEVFGDG